MTSGIWSSITFPRPSYEVTACEMYMPTQFLYSYQSYSFNIGDFFPHLAWDVITLSLRGVRDKDSSGYSQRRGLLAQCDQNRRGQADLWRSAVYM